MTYTEILDKFNDAGIDSKKTILAGGATASLPTDKTFSFNEIRFDGEGETAHAVLMCDEGEISISRIQAFAHIKTDEKGNLIPATEKDFIESKRTGNFYIGEPVNPAMGGNQALLATKLLTPGVKIKATKIQGSVVAYKKDAPMNDPKELASRLVTKDFYKLEIVK